MLIAAVLTIEFCCPAAVYVQPTTNVVQQLQEEQSGVEDTEETTVEEEAEENIPKSELTEEGGEDSNVI